MILSDLNWIGIVSLKEDFYRPVMGCIRTRFDGSALCFFSLGSSSLWIWDALDGKLISGLFSFYSKPMVSLNSIDDSGLRGVLGTLECGGMFMPWDCYSPSVRKQSLICCPLYLFCLLLRDASYTISRYTTICRQVYRTLPPSAFFSFCCMRVNILFQFPDENCWLAEYRSGILNPLCTKPLYLKKQTFFHQHFCFLRSKLSSLSHG